MFNHDATFTILKCLQGKTVILFSSLVLLNFVYVNRYIIKYNMLTTNK